MLVYNKNIVMKGHKNKKGNMGRKSIFYFFGVFVALSSIAIPLSRVTAKEIVEQDKISISIGIAKMIAIETTLNDPGTGVSYENGVYSKTMTGGERLENFGTTTFKIICNFKTNDDPTYYGGYNCKDNGWTLNATPVHTAVKEGVTYASMAPNNTASPILSKNNSFSSAESNWAFQVSSVARTIDGVDVSPTVAQGFDAPHIIPATSTPIASGKSWKTISGTDTYIDHFGISVQYGINIDDRQAAGTYTGAVSYTALLKASS